MRKSMAALAIAGVALVGVAGCNTDTVKTGADQPNSQQSSDSGKKAAAPAKVGEPITIEGNGEGSKLQVTVMKVADPVQSTNDFAKPDAGQRYVGVQFQLKNVGTAAYSDSPSNGAKVVDAKGQQFDATFMVDKIDAGPLLPSSTKIAAGGQALGFLVFEVPDGSQIAKVQFSMDSGFGETAEWVTS